jgi:molecular chaperone GrpE
MTEKALTKLELEQLVHGLEKDLDEAAERLAEAEAKRDEYLDDVRRLAAEFDNYRKRAARDQQALVARAHEHLVRELLPVLDDLERAVEAASLEDGDATPSAGNSQLGDGVRLVERQLREVLAREGLVEIPTDCPFDPHVHEALLTQESEAEEGMIVQVLQKGYQLGDRVLRPARVAISGGLAKAE